MIDHSLRGMPRGDAINTANMRHRELRSYTPIRLGQLYTANPLRQLLFKGALVHAPQPSVDSRQHRFIVRKAMTYDPTMSSPGFDEFKRHHARHHVSFDRIVAMYWSDTLALPNKLTTT